MQKQGKNKLIIITNLPWWNSKQNTQHLCDVDNALGRIIETFQLV